MECTIFMTTCPLERQGRDKLKSAEFNYSVGEYYCHNCHEFGNVRDWNNNDEEE